MSVRSEMNGYYSREQFTNRRLELARLESAYEATLDGKPARIAFLGLRRIGKSILFDRFVESKRTAGRKGLAIVDFERAVSNPETFSQVYVGTIAGQIIGGAKRRPRDFLRLENALSTELGESKAFREVAGRILTELRKADHDQALLYELALGFPQELAEELGEAIMLFIDEFQYLMNLRRYKGIGDPRRLLKATLERQNMVGYVIAGSEITILEDALQSHASPLFGMFARERLGPFDKVDSLELIGKLAPGLGARAAGKICDYSGGNPFYITAIAQKTAGLIKEEGFDEEDGVDHAFLEEVLADWGRIFDFCYYLMEISLDRARGSGNLKALLQLMAEENQGMTATEIARLAHKTPQATRNYLLELCRFDILERERDLFSFRDPLFKYWLANLRTGIAWSTTPTRADVWMSLDQHREALKALSDELGTAKESVLREVLGLFDGQLIAGELLGAGEDIVLPKFDKVEPFIDENGEELEAVGQGKHIWACELKWRRSTAGETEVRRLLERARKIRAERAWLISKAGFTREALALMRKESVLHSNGDQLREIEKVVRRET